MMPLAPNFSYSMALVLDGPNPGLHVGLFHKETGAQKNFFLAGVKNVAPIANHMESLTEDQCNQFVAVKSPKRKKVDGE